MPAEPSNPETEAHEIATATDFLERHGIPAGAREFRLRQEFFRFKWDVRVREEGGGWTVRAVKPDRPDVDVRGSTEGNALRLALAQAINSDETAASS